MQSAVRLRQRVLALVLGMIQLVMRLGGLIGHIKHFFTYQPALGTRAAVKRVTGWNGRAFPYRRHFLALQRTLGQLTSKAALTREYPVVTSLSTQSMVFATYGNPLCRL